MKLKKEETIVQAQDMTCYMVRIYQDGETLHPCQALFVRLGHPMEKWEIGPEEIAAMRKKIDAALYKETGKRVEPDDFSKIQVFH